MGQRVRVQGEGTEPRRYTADIPDPAESRRGESRGGGDGGGRRTETAQSEERVGSGCGTGRAVLSSPRAIIMHTPPPPPPPSDTSRRRSRQRGPGLGAQLLRHPCLDAPACPPHALGVLTVGLLRGCLPGPKAGRSAGATRVASAAYLECEMKQPEGSAAARAARCL